MVPAPTETSTYCHTLSLHDALPICDRDGMDAQDRRAPAERQGFALPIEHRAVHRTVEVPVLRLPRQQPVHVRAPARRREEAFIEAHEEELPLHEGRSEEHTSELQSLMRLSYAAFCLKKKKKY